MTRLRARVAERLKGAQNTYAMLTTFNEVDMTALMQLRADFKARPPAVLPCLESLVGGRRIRPRLCRDGLYSGVSHLIQPL
jgi:hypothetical protein